MEKEIEELKREGQKRRNEGEKVEVEGRGKKE